MGIVISSRSEDRRYQSIVAHEILKPIAQGENRFCCVSKLVSRGGWTIGVSLRRRCGTSGSCRNEVTALVARGYCGGAGPRFLSCYCQ